MHVRNPMLFCLGVWGPFAGVLFAEESRKIWCSCPSLEWNSSLWCTQRGIDTQNGFGSVPRASRVYFENFCRSSKQREVTKWARVPASYQHFLRGRWARSCRAFLLRGNAASLPLPSPARSSSCMARVCYHVFSFILLFSACSLGLVFFCCMSCLTFPHFLQFPSRCLPILATFSVFMHVKWLCWIRMFTPSKCEQPHGDAPYLIF